MLLRSCKQPTNEISIWHQLIIMFKHYAFAHTKLLYTFNIYGQWQIDNYLKYHAITIQTQNTDH